MLHFLLTIPKLSSTGRGWVYVTRGDISRGTITIIPSRGHSCTSPIIACWGYSWTNRSHDRTYSTEAIGACNSGTRGLQDTTQEEIRAKQENQEDAEESGEKKEGKEDRF